MSERTFQPGDRVWCQFEGPATVEEFGEKFDDPGSVHVRVDQDQKVVSAATPDVLPAITKLATYEICLVFQRKSKDGKLENKTVHPELTRPDMDDLLAYATRMAETLGAELGYMKFLYFQPEPIPVGLDAAA